ncbi:MAG: T9SS type A sorting domain-containing protein [Candidatus Staskawiczbacteria bacterium]
MKRTIFFLVFGMLVTCLLANNAQIPIYKTINSAPFVYNYDTIMTNFVPLKSGLNGTNDYFPVGDFNGDGNTDVIMTNIFGSTSSLYGSTSILYIYTGKGNGRFNTPTKICENVVTDFDFVNQEHLADFNGDGKIDILMHQHSTTSSTLNSGDTIWVLLNNGNGTFTSTPKKRVPESAIWRISTGDFNGDGKMDIFGQYDSYNTNFVIYFGNGDGTFATAKKILIGPVNKFHENHIVGDFNGDGKLDMASFYAQASNETNNSKMNVYLGNGDGTFSSTPITTLSNSYYCESIYKADFNNDDKLDLLICDHTNYYKIFLNNGDGSFSVKEIPDKILYAINNATIGDINNDGNIDIMKNASDSLTLLIGKGDGSFYKQINIPHISIHNIWDLPCALGDFNKDGKTDLVFASKVDKINNRQAGLCIMLNNAEFKAPVAINAIQKYSYVNTIQWTTYNNHFATGFLIDVATDDNFTNIIDSYKMVFNYTTDTMTYISNLVEYETDYYYRVKAFNVNNVSTFSNIIKIPINRTGLEDANINKAVIFPNPSTSYIQLKGIEGKANLSLFDIDGKLLLTKQFTDDETISVSSLPKGIYTLKIQTTTGVVERKLVKN